MTEELKKLRKRKINVPFSTKYCQSGLDCLTVKKRKNNLRPPPNPFNIVVAPGSGSKSLIIRYISQNNRKGSAASPRSRSRSGSAASPKRSRSRTGSAASPKRSRSRTGSGASPRSRSRSVTPTRKKAMYTPSNKPRASRVRRSLHFVSVK